MGDKRWYFVRNLILILRNLEDPSILPAIQKLIRYPHRKVREEVFKTLSQLHDLEADRVLLEDLSSQQKELQLHAVQLAEYSRSPEVFQKLLELLGRGSMSIPDLDLKNTIVQTLAKIRNPECLPHLARLLRSTPLFHRQAMNSLKAETIRSLEFYPPAESIRVLKNFLAAEDGDLSQLASQTLKKLQERMIS